MGRIKKIEDSLKEYERKRDFGATPEPRAGLVEHRSPLVFVIQKHLARQVHYDLRLELEGVLKSWAVPKGPSFDPSQKRLAVEVEDHPLEYAGFEGEIPAPQYGAGTVVIWDRGTWEPEGDPQTGLEAGHLKFRLRGQKMQGGWALVRLRSKPGDKKASWLLIKERDSLARPEAEFDVLEAMPDSVNAAEHNLTIPTGAKPAVLPAALSPQLATLVEKIPANDEWIYEIKFDGYRVLARVDGDQVRLFTRNGIDWTSRLNHLVPALRELKIGSGWLDGEIVLLGEGGLPDFGALQNAFETPRLEAVHYYVFDLPFYAGFDLREVGLMERRALLSQILSSSISAQISLSEDFSAAGQDILNSACRLGLEGIMGKRKDSNYISGRTRSWIKLKCVQRQEFILVGYTESPARKEGIKALLLAVYDEAGRLRYAGRVGTGFDEQTAAKLKKLLASMEVEQTPLYDRPKNLQAHWVTPQLVAEIAFAEWTKDGRVRQPVFKGLREDKPASSISREIAQIDPVPNNKMPASANEPAKPVSPESLGLVISNPSRVIDPSTGLKKLDLVNYYQLASSWMLPHLDNRPVAFLRAPEGISGQLFFQKHGDTLKIPGLKQLDLSCDPGHPALLEIDSPTALIGAVQMNVVEFHTWNATIRDIEKPDRMIFDLDPGEKTGWAMMLEAAELTRIMLEELGLRSFVKTSGGIGLHIVVPLTPRDDWDSIKEFSKAAAQHLAKVIPKLFSAVSGPRNRLGKIYIDYNRNTRGATTVAAYSARARSGMGVSMPCSWSELSSLKGGAHWTIENAGSRLETKQDPWADYSRIQQDLREAGKKIMPK